MPLRLTEPDRMSLPAGTLEMSILPKVKDAWTILRLFAELK